MQSLNQNHQNEVYQLLSDVNELLCSPSATSSDCCCKVSDLKMQVIQLRNDMLVLGYGTFFRRLKQYKSIYKELLCKICTGNMDAVCKYGRSLYINQIQNVTYTIASGKFIINSITTTMGSVLGWMNITAYNSETNATISVNPSSFAEISIGYLGSSSRLIVTFICTDYIDNDLRFSVFIVGQNVVAISLPIITQGAGYPMSSNYYIRENINPNPITPQTTYIGYTSTKTTTLSSAGGADVIYNDLGHFSYYDINAVYSNTVSGGIGNRVLPARAVLRQTCLVENDQCVNITSGFQFNKGLSSYNSGTDIATFIFNNSSDYKSQSIDYIIFEEAINAIYIDSLTDYGAGIVTISGGNITITIKGYSAMDLNQTWDVTINTMLKTCNSFYPYTLSIPSGDLPQI
jgi:hypothetical protein